MSSLAARRLLCGIAIGVLAWFTVITEGFAAPDESWFLQVLVRLQSGETLYRDVYFNATPLSIYVTLGLASVFPAELALVRSVVAVALIATIAICWLLCRLLGAERLAPWLLVCAWNRPAPYTPVAMVFFAAAFYATAVWMRRRENDQAARKYLWRAAVFAGLCFAAKQNTGLYCLGALLMAVLIVSGARLAVRHGAVILGTFVLTCLAVLLPVYLTGGLDRLVLHGFQKTTYLQMGGTPYVAPVERFLATASGPWTFDTLAAAYREFAYLLPVVAFGVLALACLRSRAPERQTALVVATYVTAGYLVVYPQQGGSLIMFAIPVLLVGIAYGWSTVRPLVSPRWALAMELAVTMMFVGQVCIRFVRDARSMVSPAYVASTIPHFRGIRVRETEHAARRNEAGLLSTLAADEPLFLIGPNAGFYYLAAGLRNPDRFDFPYVSVFGPTGQQEVIARVLSGDIRSVFVFSNPEDRQTPVLLLDFVRGSMRPVRREPLGVFYRRVD